MSELSSEADRSTESPRLELATPSEKTGHLGKFDSGDPEVGFPQLRPPVPEDPALPVPTRSMPRKGVRVARRRRLLRTAGRQHGLFTVEQAAQAGLDRRARHHHLSYGNWRRTQAPGVLRLAGWPPDPLERLRAWQLWAGPEACLTSWTALGLLGLTASGPRVPVDLEVSFGLDRGSRRRRERMLSEIHSVGSPSPARLHRRIAAPATEVDGLRCRPAAESLCAAVNHQRSSIPVGVAEALIEHGHLTMSELLDAAHAVQCPRLIELAFTGDRPRQR